jgi:hypothetical protein
MASLNENLSTLSGDLKVVYSNVLTKVLPDSAIIQKRWPLDSSGNYPLVGDFFSAVIALQLPWGFSFLGNGTEGTSTNYTLGDALAGQTKPAQVYANTTVLVDNLQYQILDRASTSGGKQAVLSAMTLTGEQMAISARNVLELEILHGREGIGASSGAISTLTVTFDGATTSAGILSTLIGARVQWMQNNLTSARTANSTSNYLTVSAVNVATPGSYTLTMVETGTTGYASITTGDVMFIGGTRGVAVGSSDTSVPQYEQLGLGLQLSATSGTQFAIDKAAYVGWVANQQGTIGAITPSTLTSGAATILGRGGKLGKYVAIVSPRAWGVLNAALATNETYNQQSPSPSISKKSGTDDIMVYNGGITIEVVSHPFQKDGKYYMFPENELHRIGSTDLTFAVPGRPEGDEYYFPVNGMAAMQRQCRADFQCVLLTPPSGLVGTGISYS